MSEKSNNSNPKDLHSERKKVIDQIDQSQLKEGSKDDYDDELDDQAQDQDQSTSPWTEEKEESEEIAPIERAGSSSIEPTKDMRERFAKTLEEPTTKDSVLRDQLKMKMDKPADGSVKGSESKEES
jgi:hypothetical protein